MSNDKYIEGLLRERAGYLRLGRADRAAVVEEELRKQGHEVESDRPKGRTAKTMETAEGETTRRGPGRPRKTARTDTDDN